jgi:uncharacterized protein YqfA (UPF0365 family)
MLETILITTATIILIVFIFVFMRYGSLWLWAYFAGTRISLLSLPLMSLRRISPRVIVQSRVMLASAGLPGVSTKDLETQVLAGGDVQRVTLALISAHRAGIDLNWDDAAAIDLAGRDILEAVQVSVKTKVIDCPESKTGRGGFVTGVARDGIQLKVRARVTVRTNLTQLVGGATEATVIARVGQGIVSAIGSCDSYQEALADPLMISRQVIDRGLDSQTAYAIVSIDIADIDVGLNVGARLQIDQAHADLRIARANAEKQRAMAIALQQEMVALTREKEADVVLADSQIPSAEAEAFRTGQLRPASRPSKRRRHDQVKFEEDNRIPRPDIASDPGRNSRQIQTWESEGGNWEEKVP